MYAIHVRVLNCRLLSYVDGIPLSTVQVTDKQLFDCGKLVAKVSEALKVSLINYRRDEAAREIHLFSSDIELKIIPFKKKYFFPFNDFVNFFSGFFPSFTDEEKFNVGFGEFCKAF